MWEKVGVVAGAGAVAVAVVASGMSDMGQLLLALGAVAWLAAVAYVTHNMSGPRFSRGAPLGRCGAARTAPTAQGA